jgi:prepilin signal peptidase PulO-like enzyme (type II secretory pathway)
MGGGDVAMMAMVGAFLGWESVCVTIFLGSCIGVLLHLAALAFARRSGNTVASPTDPDVSPTPEVDQRDAEFKTAAQLKREGYIPFGVSLAIAAGILLVTDARWWVVGWVASYARLIGL